MTFAKFFHHKMISLKQGYNIYIYIYTGLVSFKNSYYTHKGKYLIILCTSFIKSLCNWRNTRKSLIWDCFITVSTCNLFHIKLLQISWFYIWAEFLRKPMWGTVSSEGEYGSITPYLPIGQNLPYDGWDETHQIRQGSTDMAALPREHRKDSA